MHTLVRRINCHLTLSHLIVQPSNSLELDDSAALARSQTIRVGARAMATVRNRARHDRTASAARNAAARTACCTSCALIAAALLCGGPRPGARTGFCS